MAFVGQRKAAGVLQYVPVSSDVATPSGMRAARNPRSDLAFNDLEEAAGPALR